MTDIKEKILNIANQTYVPTDWSQILSEACLKAESRLGFELDAKPSGNNNCIWIIVKPSLNFSEKSSSNINITGLDYYETIKYEDLTFETQVGFRNYWYNELLFPKLIKYRAIIELIINTLYPSCQFYRQLRFARTFYASNIENYPSTAALFEHLENIVDKKEIFIRNQKSADVISRLKNLRPSNNAEINKYRADLLSKFNPNDNHKNYYWFEYFKISTLPLNRSKLLKRDSATIKELEKQIEFHVLIMIIIDLICEDNPETVARVIMLIDIIFKENPSAAPEIKNLLKKIR